MRPKRIAVFDTKPEDCAATAAVIRAYYHSLGQEVEIAAYTKAYPFACDFAPGRFDMAFLAMNSPLNLDTARKAAAADPACPLIFVSDTDDYGLEAHRLMAVDYLRKPVTVEGVERAVSLLDTAFGKDRQRVRAFQAVSNTTETN